MENGSSLKSNKQGPLDLFGWSVKCAGQCVPVLAELDLDCAQAVQCRTQVAVPEYVQTGGFDTFRPIMGCPEWGLGRNADCGV